MSDLLIKGMEMPPTGVYIASVDNSDKDKPILLLYQPKDIGDTVVNTVAWGEMMSISPHGRLIDESVLNGELWKIRRNCQLMDDTQTADKIMRGLYLAEQAIKKTPTIIPMEE